MRIVSDHAVVRFLERVKGVDLEAVRNILRRLADEAVPEKKGDHYWHSGEGIMLLIGERGQIITILSPEQAQKHTGRKLKNGERISNPPSPSHGGSDGR